MNTSTTHHAAAFSLAAMITLGLLFGLNGLAHNEDRAAQQLAQTTATQPA